MRRSNIALAWLALAVGGCSQSFPVRGQDGGRFDLPDGGVYYDARPPAGDATLISDAGPYVCGADCPDGSYCGCVGRTNPSCGCNPRGMYVDECDPQVAESCRWPYSCVRARKVDGVYYLCSDGRESTPCSPTEMSCNTSNGCVCLSTPIGYGCSCQGATGQSPLFCNPNVPGSCPEGSCVRVDAPGGGYAVCSSGGRNEPCEAPGDPLCVTSLGCTCPLVAGRESCRCSEPGTVPGEACDPRVQGACGPSLSCVAFRGKGPGEFYTECAAEGGRDAGGSDPFACDPLMPLCPLGYSCLETTPGRFRCVPDR